MKRALDDTHLLSCGELLIRNNLTIGFAESATAGRISAEFAMIPNAGKFLKGGIVCYDAELKCTLLKVPEDLLKSFSPESEIVTRLITQGLRTLLPADIHIGCTGLTAPGGSESKEKPVGTMFLHAINGNHTLFQERIMFQGTPQEIVLQTVQFLAKRLEECLEALN